MRFLQGYLVLMLRPSQVVLSGATWCWFVPLLVMLALITFFSVDMLIVWNTFRSSSFCLCITLGVSPPLSLLILFIFWVCETLIWFRTIGAHNRSWNYMERYIRKCHLPISSTPFSYTPVRLKSGPMDGMQVLISEIC